MGDTSAVVGILKALDESIQKSLKAANLGGPGDGPETASATKEQNKRQVFMRVVFIKLGDVNTVQENFHADIFVQARWHEPKLDSKGKTGEKDMSDWNKYWNPKMYIDNCLGEPKESLWYILSHDENGEAYICQRRRVKGTFYERMELNSYPFDSQDLALTMTTHRGEDEVELIQDPCEISVINTQSFIDEQEWKLHKHISSSVNATTNAYKSSKHKHPALTVSCKASRRFNFFIWNIILIMVFIGILLFTTFAVDVTLLPNRLQLSFILLLSNITFKFNIAQTLPKVSYLTLLDKYVIIQMGMMCLVCLWHASMFLIYQRDTTDPSLAIYIDRIGFGVLLGLYVLFQLIFMFYATFLVKHKLKLFTRKEEKQNEMLDLMDKHSTGKKGKRHQILPIEDDSQPTKKDEPAPVKTGESAA